MQFKHKYSTMNLFGLLPHNSLGEIIYCELFAFLKLLSTLSAQRCSFWLELQCVLPGERWEGSCIEHLICAENQTELCVRQPCEVGVIIHIPGLERLDTCHKQE